MIERAISNKILSLIKKYPAITVTGPRQSGKTTLLKHLFPSYKYLNLEDHVIRGYLESDARSYLSQFTSGVIIDEAQKYPDLFSYIQIIADEVQKDGMFILSGSQNFILMKSISQSLAGRVSIFHLMPFTKRELEKKRPFNLMELTKPGILSVENFDFLNSMFTGFYPRIHDKKLDPQEWLANYFELYVQRDIREIINIGNLSLFINFVKMCAGRVGQLLNLSSLAADCGINHSTAERWISLLETSFIVYRLRPYYRNFSKRIIKSPKLYFYDTGLLCYLLGIKKPEEIRFSLYRGNIFEDFVISEVIKSAYNRKEDPGVYFFRDSSGNEIDLIIEDGQKLIPVEIKSAETFNTEFIKGLNYWKKLTGDEQGEKFVIYGGKQKMKYKGVNVIPAGML